MNELDPDLRHDDFTPEEEAIIEEKRDLHGNKWTLIAKHLPGRSEGGVKNQWYVQKSKHKL